MALLKFKMVEILNMELSTNHLDIAEAFDQMFILTQNNSTVRIIGTTELFRMIDKSLDFVEFPIELFTKEIFNSSKIKVKPSYNNVMLFKDLHDVLAILAKANLQYFRLDGFYILLSFSNCNETNEKKIFEMVWKQQIYNINIICKDDEEILMKTFVPYQAGKCGSTDSVIINKFIKNSWNNENFFPSKFKSLYQCPLRVASFRYPPIIMRETLRNGTYRYYGSEMEILFLLAYAMEFTVNHTYYDYFHKGLLSDNGTATGILKQVMDKELDMAMGFYFLNFARAKYLSFTRSHYSVSIVIIIPPGAPYSSFEKLFKPLQKSVWICLIVIFVLGIIAIFIINYQSESIKNFIYGTDLRTPFTNLFNIFLNGIQNRLPNRTFARFILMIFFIFCFIIRTVYQGSLFQFLQSDDRNPELQTIDEMIKAKFTFYVRDTIEHTVKHMSFYNR